MKTLVFSILILLAAFLSCKSNSAKKTVDKKKEYHFGGMKTLAYMPFNNTDFDSTYKTIHIFVALCDNQYQGIVPVPKAIGNGQDPNNNLYWGCGYGIRTYFKKARNGNSSKVKKLTPP